MAKQSGNKTAKGTVNPATAGEPMVQIANRVPASVHKALKLACVMTGTSMGEAIEAGIGMWLAANPMPGAVVTSGPARKVRS